jgi:hypothetical protein
VLDAFNLFDANVELVAIALELFPADECLNFVRQCSYRVPAAFLKPL